MYFSLWKAVQTRFYNFESKAICINSMVIVLNSSPVSTEQHSSVFFLATILVFLCKDILKSCPEAT